MNNVSKITFAELKTLNGKSIDSIKPYEEPAEPKKGLLIINGVKVFGCFNNKVICTNNTYAIIRFLNDKKETVANISVFNINDECLIIEGQDHIYSETEMRVMFDKFKQ